MTNNKSILRKYCIFAKVTKPQGRENVIKQRRAFAILGYLPLLITLLNLFVVVLCKFSQVLFSKDEVVFLLVRVIGLLGPIDYDRLERGHETSKYFTVEF
ncbi:hypothetical protein HanRHA438_Chr13g0585761 [Helianthus annuus]|nr:hypothetical protein HanRHA438_Chr13g0585761 [Helianthus annuus]